MTRSMLPVESRCQLLTHFQSSFWHMRALMCFHTKTDLCICDSALCRLCMCMLKEPGSQQD